MLDEHTPLPNSPQPKGLSGRKKAVLFSILGIIVVAGVVVLALIFLRPAIGGEAVEEKMPDLSKDFGACDLLGVDQIKQELGAVANDIKGPKNAGFVTIDNFNEAQTCVYPIADEGSFSNMYNLNNAFSTYIYVFKDKVEKDGSLGLTDPNAFIKSKLGEKVAYESYGGEEDGHLMYTLSVYKGMRRYAFRLSQPTKEIALTKEDGQKALTKLAGLAKYPD